MRCRKSIIFCTIMAVLYAFWWYRLNGNIVSEYMGMSELTEFASVYGGYNNIRQIATIYSLGYIFLINSITDIFSINSIVRTRRDNIAKKSLIKVIVCAEVYVLIFLSMESAWLLYYFGWEMLAESNLIYFFVMLMVGLVIIYIFEGVCYLNLYVWLRNRYISMFVIFIINILLYVLLTKFENVNILYNSFNIIEEFFNAKGMNVLQWLVTQAENIILITIMYMIFQEIYRKKDIICRG